MNKFETFKEISLGGQKKEQLFQRLADVGIEFNEYAKVLFEHSDFSPPVKIRKVKLVKITLAKLSLESTCSVREFEDRASMHGLELCPLYLAAFLRLEYLDQPEGAYLTIASKKLENDENYPTGLYLRNAKNTLWLRGYKSDGFENWPSNNEFIFILKDFTANLC